MELEQLLSANVTPEDAASAAIEAGLVEDFRAALPALYSDAARGAGLEGIVAAITPWFPTYPQPERTEAEWREWWGGYTTVCGHHSQAALAGAMKVWANKATSEFLPKPGALSELARTTPTAAFKLAALVHNILQIADDRTDRQRVLENMERDLVKSEDQVQAVAEMLKEFKAKSVAGVKRIPPEKDKAPYIGGEVAPGSAFTPEMLRHLGRPIPPARDPHDAPSFDF